jgi:hypothetical protein
MRDDEDSWVPWMELGCGIWLIKKKPEIQRATLRLAGPAVTSHGDCVFMT